MNPRIRKLIGCFVILAFLGLYIFVAVSLSIFVPDHWAAELAFYIVAGMGWTLPVMPLISWMNRGPQ